jgi:GNAT superfamily N-acetyltransferase
MTIVKITESDPFSIEQKFTSEEYPLVFQYIGPTRTHGDRYYQLPWFELKENFRTVGIACVDFERFEDAIHISVLEVEEKGKGIGTDSMKSFMSLAHWHGKKRITLQAQTTKARKFYDRLGFTPIIVDGSEYLEKYLEN